MIEEIGEALLWYMAANMAFILYIHLGNYLILRWHGEEGLKRACSRPNYEHKYEILNKLHKFWYDYFLEALMWVFLAPALVSLRYTVKIHEEYDWSEVN